MNYRLKHQLKTAKYKVAHDELVHMALYAYSNRNTICLDQVDIAEAVMLSEKEVNTIIHDLHNNGYVDIKSTASGWVYEAKIKVNPAQVQLGKFVQIISQKC